MPHRVFARVKGSKEGVVLKLTPVPTGGGQVIDLTLPGLLSEYKTLASGEFSAGEVRLKGLRATRRQRWGKHLQFLELRCPSGNVPCSSNSGQADSCDCWLTVTVPRR